MSSVAILNSRSSLQQLLHQGERPVAVATWSSAVATLARAEQIPLIEEDRFIAQDERLAIHNRADDLITALCGTTIPTSDDYADWCWWALEFPLSFAFTHGARTVRLLQGLADAAPGFSRIIHDREGYLQGAVTNFLAGVLGIPSIAFPPHTAERETLHQRLDALTLPLARETVRLQWEGRPLRRDARPPMVMIHTNEIAQLVPHLITTGVPHFMLVEDVRHRWPAGYIGPQVDARPSSELAGLVAPRWPATPGIAFTAWEREFAEALAVTYQPSIREERAWATAAYGAGGVRAFLGGTTRFHDMRARVLACRDLDIPVIMVQHGMLAERPGGRGNRIQHFATHQLEWSRLAGDDIVRWGASGEVHVIGWPQGSIDHAIAARNSWRETTAQLTGPDPRPWVILTSSPLPDEPYEWGERFLRDALTAVREVDPAAPIVIKHHPFQELPEIIRALCTQWGFPDVQIVGGADPWEACAQARTVVSFKSTSVLCAADIGVPVVVYHPSPLDAIFERFPGFPIARTPEQLVAMLAGGLAGADWSGPRRYARTDVHAGVRAVAALRRILHGTRADRRLRARAALPRRPGSRRPSSFPAPLR